MPVNDWLPVQVNAGMSRCAAEVAEPSEVTSETLWISLIGPPVTAGLVEL